MPVGMFLGCSFDFLKARLLPSRSKPHNVEEFFYQKRGRRMTRIFSQGFQEKLTGRKWSEIPLSEEAAKRHDPGFLNTLTGVFIRAFSTKEPNTHKGIWKHPSLGTGYICETLERELLAAGGEIELCAKILSLDTKGDRVQSVTIEVGPETTTLQTENVISSIPLEILVQLITKAESIKNPATGSSPFRKKTVILVYLFVNEFPRFPHAWLNVTCTKTRIGRITNYAALKGAMVPEGKTALCCEFYLFDDDPMLQKENSEFAELAMSECARFNLIDRTKCFDNLVLRLPGADASQNRHNWLSSIRLGLMEKVTPYKNLYYVNRTDLDIATFAGLDAAEAILSGDRTDFDRHIDPRTIGIRSEKKAFEFKNPAGVDASMA